MLLEFSKTWIYAVLHDRTLGIGESEQSTAKGPLAGPRPQAGSASISEQACARGRTREAQRTRAGLGVGRGQEQDAPEGSWRNATLQEAL